MGSGENSISIINVDRAVFFDAARFKLQKNGDALTETGKCLFPLREYLSVWVQIQAEFLFD